MEDEYRIRPIHQLATEWMKDAQWLFCVADLNLKSRNACYAAVKKLVPRFGAREAKKRVFRIVAECAETKQYFCWDAYVASKKKHKKIRAGRADHGN